MMLVTGFGPYQDDINASGELVNSLRNDLPDTLSDLKDQLAFEVVVCDDTSRETEHVSLESRLLELLTTYKPDICLFTGQAPPYNRITVEKIATNSFMREIIGPDRPVAYWADLPGLDGLCDALETQNIPAGDSFYGGQHLCNHILYSSRYFAERDGLSHTSGFIHIPVLPEQVRTSQKQSPFMTLGMTRQALSIAIRHVLEANQSTTAS